MSDDVYTLPMFVQVGQQKIFLAGAQLTLDRKFTLHWSVGAMSRV